MDFEWYNPKAGAPIISIANYGLTFSSGAIEAMGNPKRIMLGFNTTNKTIGVKPCDDANEKGIEFYSKVKNGNVRLSSKDFIRFIKSKMDDSFQIENTATKYIAKWDEEEQILTVYLNSPIGKE
jgi:hypothetical protein